MIVQRALAAKNLIHAKAGCILAGSNQTLIEANLIKLYKYLKIFHRLSQTNANVSNNHARHDIACFIQWFEFEITSKLKFSRIFSIIKLNK